MTHGRANLAMIDGLEPRRLFSWTTVFDTGEGSSPSSTDPSDMTVNGATASASSNWLDYRFTDGSVSLSLGSLPARSHVKVQVSLDAELGVDDPDGFTLTAKVGSTTAGTSNEPSVTGAAASSGSANGSATIELSMSSREVGSWWAIGQMKVFVYSPTVSISGSTTVAENGSAQTLTVSRDGDASVWGAALSVPLTIGGTATEGTDYTLGATTVAIPAGYGSATTTFTPLGDAVVESGETATFTPNPASPAQASGGPATITLAAQSYTLSVSDIQANGASSVLRLDVQSGTPQNFDAIVVKDNLNQAVAGTLNVSAITTAAGGAVTGTITATPTLSGTGVYKINISIGATVPLGGYNIKFNLIEDPSKFVFVYINVI